MFVPELYSIVSQFAIHVVISLFHCVTYRAYHQTLRTVPPPPLLSIPFSSQTAAKKTRTVKIAECDDVVLFAF